MSDSCIGHRCSCIQIEKCGIKDPIIEETMCVYPNRCSVLRRSSMLSMCSASGYFFLPKSVKKYNVRCWMVHNGTTLFHTRAATIRPWRFDIVRYSRSYGKYLMVTPSSEAAWLEKKPSMLNVVDLSVDFSGRKSFLGQTSKGIDRQMRVTVGVIALASIWQIGSNLCIANKSDTT